MQFGRAVLCGVLLAGAAGAGEYRLPPDPIRPGPVPPGMTRMGQDARGKDPKPRIVRAPLREEPGRGRPTPKEKPQAPGQAADLPGVPPEYLHAPPPPHRR